MEWPWPSIHGFHERQGGRLLYPKPGSLQFCGELHLQLDRLKALHLESVPAYPIPMKPVIL